MVIRPRFSISADGYVTTLSGWPALIADPAFVPVKSHGWTEFQARCEAVLMGRKTFEPALGADRWPWPNLDVLVLGSDVPTDDAQIPIEADSDRRACSRSCAPQTAAAMSTSSEVRRRSRLSPPRRVGQARARGVADRAGGRHAADAGAVHGQQDNARGRSRAAGRNGRDRLCARLSTGRCNELRS